ncbi:MAG: alkaline shock response membrane anchor protein AmaP [Ardenticatenaceae bacterium]|nr:alkaline shock response membrane anchor protein AmaP [Ardenticatenaceae bacterium]
MLNMFNRILAVLLLAMLILCALLGAVGVWMLTLIPTLRAAMSTQASALIDSTGQLTPQLQAIISGVALLVLFILALLLILELRPAPGEELIPVKTSEGGETRMVSSAVAQRLHYAIDRLDDVVDVTPRIHSRGDGVEVMLDVRTSPEIDVPMKDNEIKQVTRQVIEEQMGLKLKKLAVRIDHAPFESA